MILIVNTTADTSVTDDLKNSLAGRGADFEIIEAGGLRISPCIGCNHCWLKTPGECAVKDDFEGILKSWDADTVTLAFSGDEEITFRKKEIALIRQAIDF